MFSLKRLLIRLGFWVLLLVGITYGVLVWWCARQLAAALAETGGNSLATLSGSQRESWLPGGGFRFIRRDALCSLYS